MTAILAGNLGVLPEPNESTRMARTGRRQCSAAGVRVVHETYHHPGQSLSDQVCGVSSNHHSLCSSYERTSTIQDSKESTCYSTSPSQALVAGGLEYPYLFREGVQEGTGTLRGLVWSVLFKSTGQTVWLAAATTARER